MPRQAADLEEALNKKGGLTLSQLANYDDLITDALVDRVYYWSSIRKLKANYHPCRGVEEEAVCKILQQHVIIEKDPIEAHAELLELKGIAKYLRSLKTDDEKEHFERHLRKYVNIYLPDCPFEVDTTNRYTIMTSEACIKARRFIKKGETIKYLCGIQVEMSEKEEKELSSRTDFSIVLSSRRKRPSLFLGPARFANHDCDSNAKLNTTGPHGIHIVARKDIRPGEEITVTYGDDYFGIDNCECLCATCEKFTRNGWDPRGPVLHEDSSDEEEDEENSEAATPGPNLNVQSQSRSQSALGKRKRIDDEIAVSRSGDPHHYERQPRDGQHKHQRAGEGKGAPGMSASSSKQHQSQHRHRRRPSDRESVNEIAQIRRNSRGRILPQAEDSATPSRSRSPLDQQEWSPSPSPSAFLEKIFNLLESIGEKKIKEEEELRSKTVTPSPAASSARELEPPPRSEATPQSTANSREILSQNTDITSNRSDSPLSSAQSTPPYARRLSRSPSAESSNPHQRNKSPEKSKLEAHRARLQAIKKERSVSSLRKVMNAEDEETSLYSIPPSPPPSEKSKDVHSSSHKDLAENELTHSTGSSSPSSHNDTFSSTSQTSSLTSLESEPFAAGNIALSICQMLTTEEDDEAEEEQLQSTGGAEIVDAMDIDEEPSTDSLPARGRRQLRSSPRKAAHTTSTPPVESIEMTEQEALSEDDEKRGEARTPGDYTLCKALLSTTYHRWIECRNCDEYFVQGDAYLTRIACPRCERHSKLYGFYWPKTDKDGKFDKEERVLDHRTIHRFIDPEEERGERKGRKTLVDVIRDREVSSKRESEELETIEKRLRNSPRRSESRRKMRMTM